MTTTAVQADVVYVAATRPSLCRSESDGDMGQQPIPLTFTPTPIDSGAAPLNTATTATTTTTTKAVRRVSFNDDDIGELLSSGTGTGTRTVTSRFPIAFLTESNQATRAALSDHSMAAADSVMSSRSSTSEKAQVPPVLLGEKSSFFFPKEFTRNEGHVNGEVKRHGEYTDAHGSSELSMNQDRKRTVEMRDFDKDSNNDEDRIKRQRQRYELVGQAVVTTKAEVYEYLPTTIAVGSYCQSSVANRMSSSSSSLKLGCKGKSDGKSKGRRTTSKDAIDDIFGAL
jgi:hypothetical protein